MMAKMVDSAAAHRGDETDGDDKDDDDDNDDDDDSDNDGRNDNDDERCWRQ